VRITGTITYRDGEVVAFETASPALAEWELYALRHGYPIGEKAPPMLSMLVVAWSELREEGEGFDTWRRRVQDIDWDEAAVEVPPTLPAQFSE
jgi:hypothetical protein